MIFPIVDFVLTFVTSNKWEVNRILKLISLKSIFINKPLKYLYIFFKGLVVALLKRLVLLIYFFGYLPLVHAGTIYDLGGSFSVGQGGDLNYNIPVLTPKGVNGLKPELVLTYSSSVDNAKMGQGWSFDNADVITRCIKNYDSNFNQITPGALLAFNWDDGYCLNGEELIATSGEYGKDGTVYRTLSDPQIKIVSYGTQSNGPAYFKIWKTNGREYELGNTVDSFFELKGTNEALSWLTNKVKDRSGNEMNYTYLEDTEGSYYPQSISYANKRIEFSYETRTDSMDTSINDHALKINKLLSNVDVYSGDNKLYTYNIAYDKSIDPSKVTNITFCYENGGCKGIDFEWSELNSAQKLHAISKITNDIGKEVQFTYAERTDLSSDSQKVYAVSQHKATNAIGGYEVVDYSYGKETIQIDGVDTECDFMKSTHADSLITTSKYYLTDDTYGGYLARAEHVYGGKPLDSTTLHYKKDEANNFIYTESESSSEYDLNEMLLKSVATNYTYDGKRNVTEIEIVTNDGYKTTTQTEYINSIDPGFMVLPTRISKVKDSPYGYENSTVSAFTYDAQGRISLEKLTTPTTETIERKYTYDSFGNVSGMELYGENTEAIKYTYSYDGQGINKISLSDPYGKSTTYQYDSRDRIIEERDHDGFFEKREYDDDGRLISKIDSKNSTTTFEYSLCSAEDNCFENAVMFEKITDGDGQETIEYKDIYGKVVASSSLMPGSKRSIIQYRFNAIGNLIGISNPRFGEDTNIYWRVLTYDLLRRPLSSGMEGSVTESKIEYDGNKVIQTDEKGNVKIITVDSKGNVVQVEDHYSNKVNYKYDGNGKLVKITKPSGAIMTYEYDDIGRLTKSIDPERGTYTYRYDIFGNLIETTDPKQQTTQMAYNKYGKIVSKSAPDYAFSWEYDPVSNRPTKVYSQDYAKSLAYDSIGNILESNVSVNGKNYNFQIEYDEFSRMKTITYPTGFGVRYEYGDNGELKRILKANIEASVVTTFLKNETDIYEFLYENVFLLPDYDKFANDKKDYRQEITYYDYLKKFFDKLVVFYSELNNPDNDGKIVSDGNVTLYNELQETSITELWDRTGEYKDYEDLFSGNAIFSNGKNYDDFIAVYMTFSTLFGEQLEEYIRLQDERSDVSSAEILEGKTKGNQGLALGHIKAAARETIEKFYKGIVTVLDKDVVIWQMNAFSPEGMVTEEEFGNGIKSTIGLDPKVRFISTLITKDLNATNIQDVQYDYDANGNIVAKEDNVLNHQESYQYDALNRLTSANYGENKTLDLSFDEEGNIVYKSNIGNYTYNNGTNLLASAGYRTFEYDANGNMVRGDGRTIEWTSFNKPSKITKNGIVTTFQYDSNHKRIVQTRTDSIDTIQRVYIGNYEEVIVNGEVREWLHYIFAGDKRVALFTVKNDMTVDIKYLHTDNLGSIKTITGPEGEVLQRLDYDPYGRRISVKTNQYTLQELEENSLITPRGYTGHEHLEESDLVHMNARLYDPILGRFISPDNIIPDYYDLNSMNRLSYVRNNPLVHTDPTGHSWLSNKINKWKKKQKKKLKRWIQNFSIDDVKKFAGSVNSVTSSLPDPNDPLSAIASVAGTAIQLNGELATLALDGSFIIVEQTVEGAIDLAGQAVDYCEENPMSCAATAMTFVSGGMPVAYVLVGFETLVKYDECQHDRSLSASETTECSNGALFSGATSAASLYLQPTQAAASAMGLDKIVLRQSDKIAIASVATILYLASESKEKEEKK